MTIAKTGAGGFVFSLSSGRRRDKVTSTQVALLLQSKRELSPSSKAFASVQVIDATNS